MKKKLLIELMRFNEDVKDFIEKIKDISLQNSLKQFLLNCEDVLETYYKEALTHLKEHEMIRRTEGKVMSEGKRRYIEGLYLKKFREHLSVFCDIYESTLYV